MPKERIRPPGIGRRILSLLRHYEEAHSFSGDMEEEYANLAEEKGRRRARLWLWSEILHAFGTYLDLSLRIGATMILNYIKTAFRNIQKQKAYVGIGLLGLAVGMACFMTITLYVDHEFHYDRYHNDSDRIFRVLVRTKFYTMRTLARTSDLAVPEIRARFPQIKAAARVYHPQTTVIGKGELVFSEDRVFFVDPELFDILTIPVLQGDAASLREPGKILLTPAFARRIFGSETPLGKTLEIDQAPYEIAGIAAAPPSNSHFQFNCLVSHVSMKKPTRQDWTRFDTTSYVKLRPGVDTADFEKKLKPLTKRILPSDDGESLRQTYLLQPVADIHLARGLLFDTHVNHANPAFLYVLAALGLNILIIACVNIANLATARSATRTREVGLRKIVGARRRQLIGQFLGESTIWALGAFLVAALLAASVLPRLAALTSIPFTWRFLFQGKMLLYWAGLILFVGTATGLYPAFVLSSLEPGFILKHKARFGKRAGLSLSRLLIIGQFAVSTLLVITTLSMHRQIQFMKNHPLGFEKQQKLIVTLPQNEAQTLDPASVKYELSDFAPIRSATLSSGVPGRGPSYAGTRLRDWTWDEALRVYHFFVDEDFVRDFRIDWVSPPLPPETLAYGLRNGVLVNQALIHAFGWQKAEDAVGQPIISGNIGAEREIVGVVRDFFFKGLNEPIEPLIIAGDPKRYRMVTLTLDTDSLPDILAFLNKKWKRLFPAFPFEYFFLDENFDRAYRRDERMLGIVSVFAGLGILIACSGLFGLAAYTAGRRTKEIGIRKVLGASSAGITALLTRQFTALALIANLIAWPAAFLVMRKWLQNFHNRTTLDPWIFLGTGLFALAMVWLSVSYQSVKTARADPVKSLRYE